MAGRLREEARAVLDRAALRIARAIIEPRDPGMRDRAGAHRARLQRHPQVAILQPLAPERLRPPRGSPASRHARSDRAARAAHWRRSRCTSPSRTTTAPTGTSPAAAAVARGVERARASGRAAGTCAPMPAPRRGQLCAVLLCGRSASVGRGFSTVDGRHRRPSCSRCRRDRADIGLEARCRLDLTPRQACLRRSSMISRATSAATTTSAARPSRTSNARMIISPR